MSYKWKPSAAKKREFAERMSNPEEQAAYEARKRSRIEAKQATSKFSYGSAGGNYVPTQAQHNFCLSNWPANTTPEQEDARNQVLYGYSCQEKIHHDYIHIVNELIRSIN